MHTSPINSFNVLLVKVTFYHLYKQLLTLLQKKKKKIQKQINFIRRKALPLFDIRNFILLLQRCEIFVVGVSYISQILYMH